MTHSDLPFSDSRSFDGGATLRPGNTLDAEDIESSILAHRRRIRVWLPPSYHSQPESRYPVLYLQDGQNMFSAEGPHVAYGWGSWEIDRSVERLVAAGRMGEVILVAIHNTPRRYQEYRGRAAFGRVAGAGGMDDHERYAGFLAEELKPAMDRRFRTLERPEHTGILGSSMGGICSLVVAWNNPGTFGLAASLSGAFQVERAQFLQRVLRPYRGPVKPLRVYLDSGASSGDGGDDGRSVTSSVATELRRIGWRDGLSLWFHVDEHLLTPAELQPFDLPQDKLREAQLTQHNELYWRLRVWRALSFLFPRF